MKSVSKTVPKHGVIIVDTCFLNSMTEEISANHRLDKDDASERLWTDALFVLAKHGFSVRIPEMVGFEAAEMLADGRQVNRFIPHPDKAINQAKEESFKRQRQFLTKVLSVQSDNTIDISIVPSTGISRSANFLSSIRDGIHLAERSLKINGSNINTRRKVKNLLAARLKSSLGNNFGDEAARDMVANIKEFPQDDKTPIFYFSSDNDAFTQMKQARPDLNIHQVSAAGFLNGLQENDLLPTIGAKIDSDNNPDLRVSIKQLVAHLANNKNALFDELNRLLSEYRVKHSDNPDQPHDNLKTRSGIEYASLIDGKGGKESPNDWLFKETLGRAKAEILAAHEAEQKANNGDDIKIDTEGLTKRQHVLMEHQAAMEAERIKQERAARFKKFSTQNATSLQGMHARRVAVDKDDTAGGDVGGGMGRRK